jgi:hypothetical protein
LFLRKKREAAIKQMGLQPPPKQKTEKSDVVFEKKARSTGATIRVLDNRQQQWFEWDDAGGYAEKWWTECTTHGFTCSHERRSNAVSWASQPEMWCDECREIARSRRKTD